MDMNLLEVEGKRLFSEYGIPVPEGEATDGKRSIEGVAFPAVVKAQVPIGGRGKAGGVRIATDGAQLDEAVKSIIGMNIKGFRVNEVLIERMVESSKELYLSIAVDRSKRRPLIIASAMGGMDIETVPDEKIVREWIDPWVGVQPFNTRNIVGSLGLGNEISREFQKIIVSLWKLFQGMDAELVEINPLKATFDNRLIAVDSKVVIDDDSLFRHEGLEKLPGDITPLEKEARDRGIAFVQLDGDIGVIANGAGLTMATLDFLTMHGGKGGVFLDLGGTDDSEKIKEALLLMAKAAPKVILINIFGGITKCDTVANGLLQALDGDTVLIPIVARIKGVNEKEAFELLKDSRIRSVLSLEEAAKMSVAISRGG